MIKTVRIAIPREAKKGEVIEIKTLVSHPMESGFRPGPTGKIVPRNIIKFFICQYLDQEVFKLEYFPAIAANPFLRFHIQALKSGTVKFIWIDQHQQQHTESRYLTVNDQ
ncbi:MAG: thiosulfate oxidation carrier complex protein SoxZ [Pseudomonadota bacterium]